MIFLGITYNRVSHSFHSLFMHRVAIYSRFLHTRSAFKFHINLNETKKHFSSSVAQRTTRGDSMKKPTKIALLVLAGATILGGVAFTSYHLKAPSPIIFSPLEGKQWVEKCLQLHPEILWLADTNVRKTEEGQASSQRSYSEQLFGKKFVEFDRTIMTLHCLKLILNGSEKAYREFTMSQPNDIKLLKESFQTLHDQGIEILQSAWGGLTEVQMAQAMETALVLGDIGKSEKAREVFKLHGITAVDHDDFYGEAIQILSKEPKLCPSFLNLPNSARNLLVKIANLAHYGHITHLEGGPAMFDKLYMSRIPSEDPIALSFDLFVHTCDVAGALGHTNNTSSLVYTELAHKAMQAMNYSVRTLSDIGKTSLDAYHVYVAIRAAWLGLNGKNATDRVLTRIGAMLRLFSPEEGSALKQAIAQLHPSDREIIIAQLDSQSIQLSRTPTYIPAVLVNLLGNFQLGNSKEERLLQAIKLGLPFICKALNLHKENLSKYLADPTIPLNFNEIAAVAKTTPEFLSQKCSIDAEGNVHLPKQ